MPSPKSILHVIAVSIHLMKPTKGLMLNKNDTKPPVKKKKKDPKKIICDLRQPAHLKMERVAAILSSCSLLHFYCDEIPAC